MTQSVVKKLLGETAIYGLSSVLGRLLFFLLTPLYTTLLSKQDYGQMTELFAYAAFLMLFFTYRIEMAFFRFGVEETSRNAVFSTALSALAMSVFCMTGLLLLFIRPLAEVLQYAAYPQYLVLVALILAADALCEIPFARLRLEGKSARFAMLKLLNISINIGFNLFFLLACPYLITHLPKENIIYIFVTSFYNQDFQISYIFIANLLAALFTFIFLLPQYFAVKWTFDRRLWSKMLAYSLPLLIVGLAGNVNELLDRVLLKWYLPFSISENESLLGEYGASYKLTMILTLFTQAFRMGAEPFFFKNANKSDAKKTYADVTKFFTIAALVGLLITLLYLDIIKYMIAPKFWAGLSVVPILLFANLFLGIYYNVSVWYRLTDRTKMGAYISILGAAVTLVCNIWWIPIFGYTGSAWATFICYGLMLVVCYWVGQRHYPVPYEANKLLIISLLAFFIYYCSVLVRPFLMPHLALVLVANSGLLALFLVATWQLALRKGTEKGGVAPR